MGHIFFVLHRVRLEELGKPVGLGGREGASGSPLGESTPGVGCALATLIGEGSFDLAFNNGWLSESELCGSGRGLSFGAGDNNLVGVLGGAFLGGTGTTSPRFATACCA